MFVLSSCFLCQCLSFGKVLPGSRTGAFPLPSMASMVQAYAVRAAAPPLPQSTGASGFRLQAGFSCYVLTVNQVYGVFLMVIVTW